MTDALTAALAASFAALALTVRVIYAHRAKTRQREIDAETLSMKLLATRDDSLLRIVQEELQHEREATREERKRVDSFFDRIKSRIKSDPPPRHTEPEADPVDPTRDTDPQTPSGRPRA